MIEVLDLFSGAGGFSLGAHAVTDDVMGIELDADAVATQRAADLYCYQRDITYIDPEHVERVVSNAHLHLHASPPCQTFSSAGKGEGRKHLDLLCEAVGQILDDGEVLVDLSDVPAGSLFVLTPAHWIRTMRPDSISLEQVRSVLPVWEAYAEGLERLGYHAWTALLSAEQYGVAQTRQRAWLGASLNHPVKPPTPTHSRYHVRKPEQLDPGVLPWVSMAEALGWNEPGLTGFPRRADDKEAVTLDGVEYRARDLRAETQPSFVVTEKARSWQHFTHYAPAGVGQKNHPAKPRPLDGAPAPTVTSEANHYFFDADDFADGEQMIKHKDDTMAEARGVNPEQCARKITVDEAGILQGFPPNFPWQGTKTSQFRQVGNAVPPAVAEAVLRSLL